MELWDLYNADGIKTGNVIKEVILLKKVITIWQLKCGF